jgi:hypothetical protein
MTSRKSRRDFLWGTGAWVAATAVMGQPAPTEAVLEKKPTHKPLLTRAPGAGIPPPAAGGSLLDVPPNVARDLGTFAWRDATDPSITDYSGLAYDAVGRRVCIFGGGHGPYQWTDIRAYDLTALQWSSLYPPTPRSEMTLANGDSDFGRWRSTNQPYARHSYNMSLVVGRRFYLMMQLGLPDYLDGPAPPWGGRICWYDFDARTWNYSRNSSAQTPWYYASAAALDPLSGNILVVGPNQQGGSGNVWVYDPGADSIVAGSPIPDLGYAHDLVYFPLNDRFYALQSDGRVWEIGFNRGNFNATTINAVSTSGSPPPAGAACGYAFDSTNRILGGNVVNGRFHAFDPFSRTWSAAMMQTLPGAVSAPSQVFHCLEFDAASGCFIFLSAPEARTWAYRYSRGAIAPARLR